MSDEKRVGIRCHNAPPCGRVFSLLRQFDGRPKFLIACPFCGAANVVELDPYRVPVREILAGGGAEPFTLDALDLPDVLPGRAPRPDEAID